MRGLMMSNATPLNDNTKKGSSGDIAAADDTHLENSDKSSTGTANTT